MKQQNSAKTYEVGELTKRVLDCKLMNAELYSTVYALVEEFEHYGASHTMEKDFRDISDQIDNFLNRYLERSITRNLRDMKNAASPKILI